MCIEILLRLSSDSLHLKALLGISPKKHVTLGLKQEECTAEPQNLALTLEFIAEMNADTTLITKLVYDPYSMISCRSYIGYTEASTSINSKADMLHTST